MAKTGVLLRCKTDLTGFTAKMGSLRRRWGPYGGIGCFAVTPLEGRFHFAVFGTVAAAIRLGGSSLAPFAPTVALLLWSFAVP